MNILKLDITVKSSIKLGFGLAIGWTAWKVIMMLFALISQFVLAYFGIEMLPSETIYM